MIFFVSFRFQNLFAACKSIFFIDKKRNSNKKRNVWLVLAGVWCGGIGLVQHGSNYMCTPSCIWICIYICRELDRRLKQERIENVSIYCVSPGWCKTSLHRNTDLPWYAYILALPVAALFMKSAKEVCKMYFSR